MDATLLDIPTYASSRARLTAAVAAGHPMVLLLGQHDQINTVLLGAVARDLAGSGRAVHHVAADRLRGDDLANADPRIVVALDRADLLSRLSLLAIEDHLRRNRATQLLLAGLPSFRALTAAPGLATLHFAPLVVALPRLPAADAAAYLRTLPNAPRRPHLLRAAAGDPLAIERLANHRLLPSLAEVAEIGPVARLLDRPLAALAGSLVLAVLAAAVAAPIAIHPRSHQVAVGPPPALPPIQAPAPLPAAGPAYAVTDGSGAASDATATEPGVIVDQIDPDDLLAPHIVHARPGDTLRALYARIYRGLDAPSFASVHALNPVPLKPGARIVFPAPADGWPAR